MARLEDEFKHLLSENKLPFELEHASFRSDLVLEEGSFGAASTEDLIIGSSRRNSEEIVIDLIRPEVISDLKSIATTMIASGTTGSVSRCVQWLEKRLLTSFFTTTRSRS
ncbi:hypothetical protein Bca52824_055026 [Brassica carinata]|uniref:Uncharacterized protein n=1 Tax=Brassica carinata TaxID=52824 RepID=A0A8X7UPM8_BRACI|nr:hypothetical protein Bca52824_055026 [Brassica carinata]